MSTSWRGGGHFINPMCGSGTLGIEAALIGLDKAPGLLRNDFAFMHLRNFRQGEWSALRQEARRKTRKGLGGRMILTDIDPDAVEAAKKNALTAGVERPDRIRPLRLTQTLVPAEGGLIILNPEYGERLGQIRELERVYKGIGDFFKQHAQGYTGYVFTGNRDLAKKIGLKTRRRFIFYNSQIESQAPRIRAIRGKGQKVPVIFALSCFSPRQFFDPFVIACRAFSGYKLFSNTKETI